MHLCVHVLSGHPIYVAKLVTNNARLHAHRKF